MAMITDNHSPAADSLLQANTQLEEDLSALKRELDRAQEVWGSTVAKDREEFAALLNARKAEWEKQESDWDAQRSAYEKKITDLESTFQSQLTQLERSATGRYQDLEESNRREKSLWQSSISQQLKDFETKEKAWEQERRDLLLQAHLRQEEVLQLQREFTAAQPLHQENLQLHDRIKEHSAQIEALKRDHELVQEAALIKRQDLERELQNARADYAAQESSRRQSEERRLIIEAEMTSAKVASASRIQQTEARVLHLEAQLQSASREKSNLLEEIQRRQTENAVLQEKSVSQDAASMARIAELTNTTRRLESECETMRKDRSTWEELMARRLSELHERESSWTTQQQTQEYLIRNLQDQIFEFQNRLRGIESRRSAAPALEKQVEALESEISALQELLRKGHLDGAPTFGMPAADVISDLLRRV